MFPTPILLLIAVARAIGFNEFTRELSEARLNRIRTASGAATFDELALEDLLEATFLHWSEIAPGGAAAIENTVRHQLELAIAESEDVRRDANRQRMLQAVNLRIEGARFSTVARLMSIEEIAARSLVRQAWLYLCRRLGVDESAPSLLTPRLTTYRRIADLRPRAEAAIASWAVEDEQRERARQILNHVLSGLTLREAAEEMAVPEKAVRRLAVRLWQRLAERFGVTVDSLNDTHPELRSLSKGFGTGLNATRKRVRTQLYSEAYYGENAAELIRRAIERRQQS